MIASLLPAGQLQARLAAITQLDHALDALLRERLYGIARAAWFPGLSDADRQTLDQRLAEARLQESVRYAIRERHFLCALAALEAAGVRPIVLKGFALAHTLYETPIQRPSLDLDVIIDVHDVPVVHQVMRELGWTLPYGVRGQYTSHQFTWATGDEGPTRALIDFHWRITNRPQLSRTLTHNELRSRAQTQTLHGTTIHTIAHVDALLHAVIHLVAHHRDDAIPALWYLDIALLEQRLSPQERVAFLRAVAANGISALCADVWRQAEAAIAFAPSRETRWMLHSFDQSSDVWQRMPQHRTTEILADLIALRVEDRFPYLRELAFPNEASMRLAYGERDATTPLWQLHMRRFFQFGVRR